MNTEKIEKYKDSSKLNVGVELEFYLVYIHNLLTVSAQDMQKIFEFFVDDFGWEPKYYESEEVKKVNNSKKEIIRVSKKIEGELFYCEPEIVVSMLEARTFSPVSDLVKLERIHKEFLENLNFALRKIGAMIWPFAVAPAFSGLYKIPKISSEYSKIPTYQVIGNIEDKERYAHIASNQVNIDCPFEKIIPAINALYKNLGKFVRKWANGPAFFDGKLYRRGRDYWLLDFPANPAAMYGLRPSFPDQEFGSLQDYFERIFEVCILMVERDGESHSFVDTSMTPNRFFELGEAMAVDRFGKEQMVKFLPKDLGMILACNWLDFKPHFDLKEEFLEIGEVGVKEFLAAYRSKNLDYFLKKNSKNWWLEIRCCDAQFANSCMDIPRYFYEIFSDLDRFIEESSGISWEDFRKDWEESLFLN